MPWSTEFLVEELGVQIASECHLQRVYIAVHRVPFQLDYGLGMRHMAVGVG